MTQDVSDARDVFPAYILVLRLELTAKVATASEITSMPRSSADRNTQDRS
jgi:hypothetical protein